MAGAAGLSAGFEAGVPATDLVGAGGFVAAGFEGMVEDDDGVLAGAELSGVAEAPLDPAELGAAGFAERRKYRGIKSIASNTAAAAPTSTSVFELEGL